MNCDMARLLLAAYVDNETTREEKTALAGHLESCPSCAREMRWMSAIRSGLRALPQPAMPEGLTAELLRLARQRKPNELSFWEALRLSWRMPAGVGLASALALGACFLIFTQFLSGGTDELSLDEVLMAHNRYALTMPAADRDTLYTGRAGEASDDDL